MVGKLWFWCKILTGRADGGAETLLYISKEKPRRTPFICWLITAVLSSRNCNAIIYSASLAGVRKNSVLRSRLQLSRCSTS